jgi:hypothetical protein
MMREVEAFQRTPISQSDVEPARRVGLKDQSCGPLQRGHVDDEAIVHVFVHGPLVRTIDLVRSDQFDIRLDVAGRAVVDELLSFGNAADHRARKALAAKDQTPAARARSPSFINQELAMATLCLLIRIGHPLT